METLSSSELKPMDEIFEVIFDTENFRTDRYNRTRGKDTTDPSTFLKLFGDTSIAEDPFADPRSCPVPPPSLGQLLESKIYNLKESVNADDKLKAEELKKAIATYAAAVFELMCKEEKLGFDKGMGLKHLLDFINSQERFEVLIEALNNFYARQKDKALKLNDYTFLGEALATHQKDGSLLKLWNDVIEGRVSPRTLEPLKKRYTYGGSKNGARSSYDDWCNAERYEVAILGVGMQRVDFETLKANLRDILKKADSEFEDDTDPKRKVPRLLPENLSIVDSKDPEHISMGLRLERDQKIAEAFKKILSRDDLSQSQKEELEAMFDSNSVAALREDLSTRLRAVLNRKYGRA